MNDELRSRTTESASMTIQDGDVRAAVLSLIQNDDDIMKKILETVTQAIIQKLMDSPNFLEKLAKNVLKNGVLDNIKQDIYVSCAVDNGHTTDTIRNLERRVVDLERANKELRDDSDTQEQYSRRNCLLLHGVSEEQTDSDKAVLSVCNGKLGLQLTSDCIDRSHRLGHTHNNGSSNGKPRPIIVKLKSYDARRSIFGAKRKLKGTRLVITENLTKQRMELLRKARTVDEVKSTWTIDGRIICLLTSGRKETIVHERDLVNLRELCRQ